VFRFIAGLSAEVIGLKAALVVPPPVCGIDGMF
jgi:hypothetical protein